MPKMNQSTEVSTENTVTAAPVIRATAVNERKYKLAVERPQGIKSKQASIVLDILAASAEPLTIKEIAPVAASKGLNAIGGVEPSVRYHLHHLTKGGITEVVNPTFVLE